MLVKEALENYRKMAEHLGGCSDGGCIISEPNSFIFRCRCNQDPMKMFRMVVAANNLADALDKSYESKSKTNQD